MELIQTHSCPNYTSPYKPKPKSTKESEAAHYNKRKKQEEWNAELDSLMEWSRQNKEASKQLNTL